VDLFLPTNGLLHIIKNTYNTMHNSKSQQNL